MAIIFEVSMEASFNGWPLSASTTVKRIFLASLGPGPGPNLAISSRVLGSDSQNSAVS